MKWSGAHRNSKIKTFVFENSVRRRIFKSCKSLIATWPSWAVAAPVTQQHGQQRAQV
jgi:hypothetical protein